MGEPQKIIVAQKGEMMSANELGGFNKSRVLYDDDVMAYVGFKDGDEVHYIFTGDLRTAYEGKEPTWRSSRPQHSQWRGLGKTSSIALKFPELKEHFRALDLPDSALPDAIKHQYRRLALECHPDKHPENVEAATQKFQQIKDSYQRLRERLNF